LVENKKMMNNFFASSRQGLLLVYLLLVQFQESFGASVVINEVSDKGTQNGKCLGEDWVELFHVPTDDDGASDNSVVNLAGYILHDSKGPEDDGAMAFDSTATISAGEYLIVCRDKDDNSELGGFGFGIKDDEAVTLLDTMKNIVSEVVLQGQGDFDVTYSRLADGSGGYDYTSVPTPGEANVFVSIPEKTASPGGDKEEKESSDDKEEDETNEARKQRLMRQNSLGEQFFGMGNNGVQTEDRFDDVLDFEVTMSEEDYTFTMKNRLFETYRPFQSAQLRTVDGGEILASINEPGRIRPKGAFSLIVTSCMLQDTIPFLIDFGKNNPSFFGMNKIYLRNFKADKSYIREWTLHRMLARFGLPYLRTRTVRFYINGDLIGLYEFMEAIDQEYVFQRSFPDHDPEQYALYKVKATSIDCGNYPEVIVSAFKAQTETERTVTKSRNGFGSADPVPPKEYDRGEHRTIPTFPKVPNQDNCYNYFLNTMLSTIQGSEVIRTFVEYDENCGEFLVDQGLVDRDLGKKSYDGRMKEFINQYYSGPDFCKTDGCSDSNLAKDVDIDSFLKTFAFFASVQHFDSPLGYNNNFYLADTGDNKGWKIVPYDMDSANSFRVVDFCAENCTETLVDWSILRPTCVTMDDNRWFGPILGNKKLRARYVEYMREFVNDVMLNDDLILEAMEHIRAIQKYVRVDVFHVYESLVNRRDYSLELSPIPENWQSDGPPFLPYLMARGLSIQEQLDKYDKDLLRHPEDMNNWETCVEWQTGAKLDATPNTEDEDDDLFSVNGKLNSGSVSLLTTKIGGIVFISAALFAGLIF